MSSLVAEHYDLERELALSRARQGMLGFAAYTYEHFKVAWHHRVICRTINAMHSGATPRQLLASYGIVGKKLDKLLAEPHPDTKLYAGMTSPAMLDLPMRSVQIWMPPRHGKSLLVSVSLPGWWLGKDPDARIIAATYGSSLSNELASDALRTVGSQSYREVFPGTRIGSGFERDVLRPKVTRNAFDVVGRRGKYRATSVSGALTGLASDLTIVDDPHKDRAEADSFVKREAVWRWYISTLYTRGQPGVRRIICNTRWSEDDLSGRLIARAQADPLADQWYCVVLPAILDCPPSPGDPRKEGEALWPEAHPLQVLKQTRAIQGSYEFEALFQQRPAPQGGGAIKEAWWKFYSELPRNLTNWHISVDLAVKGRNDYSCFQVWASGQGATAADRYLVDMVMERMEFTGELRAFKAICAKWPQAKVRLVEDAANGPALMSTLKREIGGILAVPVRESKSLRLQAVAPQIEAGNVYLPSPTRCPWVENFLFQFRMWPNGKHDDAIDAASQALSRMDKPVYGYAGAAPISVGERQHLGDPVTRRIPGVPRPL